MKNKSEIWIILTAISCFTLLFLQKAKAQDTATMQNFSLYSRGWAPSSSNLKRQDEISLLSDRKAIDQPSIKPYKINPDKALQPEQRPEPQNKPLPKQPHMQIFERSHPPQMPEAQPGEYLPIPGHENTSQPSPNFTPHPKTNSSAEAGRLEAFK